MVSPSTCLRDKVVYLKYLEWKVHPATSAPALLLSKEDGPCSKMARCSNKRVSVPIIRISPCLGHF